MSLAYNPETDRLNGGDFFQDFQGRPVLQLMLSMRRAKALFEAAKELKDQYDRLDPIPGASQRPFSQPLAVMQLESYPVTYRGEQRDISIDELFAHPALTDAPPEYRDLCQIVLVVPGVEPLADSRTRDTSQTEAFTRQLFRTLGCAHTKAHMTFTRQTGTCISPEQLTPAGEVIDIYYLTRSSETKGRFAEFRQLDVKAGLVTAVDDALNSGADVRRVMAEARRAYRAASGAPLHADRDGEWTLGNPHDIQRAIESLTHDLSGG